VIATLGVTGAAEVKTTDCATPFPHEFDGITVKVPPVVAFNEIEFPEPVIVPEPE
jgi:hypothetical protein